MVSDGERIARLESQVDGLFNGRLDRMSNRIDSTNAKLDSLKTTGLTALTAIIVLLAGNLVMSIIKLAGG